MDPVHFEKTLSGSRRSLGGFFCSPNLRTAAEEQGYQDSGGGDVVHNICSSEALGRYVGSIPNDCFFATALPLLGHRVGPDATGPISKFDRTIPRNREDSSGHVA